ncbi:MAG: hypothetical protein HY079_03845 [Elusimicrobia bacterium]|nr:hypothetical protein [Elusimicrobiota bacterium]
MSERLRAPLAALLALWLSGDLAARGASGLWDLGRWLWPFLFLFVAFERLRRRRRLLDDEAFLLGAAVGLLYEGAWAKTLQDGLFFLGVNWLGALSAAFDGGLVAVLALHAFDARRPRPEEGETPLPAAAATAELAVLVLVPAFALLSWALDAWSGRTRFARMLGPSWLLADLLFVGAAVLLARRALSRADAPEPPPRDRGLWLLAAFLAWLTPAQFFGRLGGEWLSPLSTLYLLGWTAAFGVWARMLWRERAHWDPSPRRASTALLRLAAWRLLGSAAVLIAFGTPADDPRAASAYAFLVDLPVRLLFFSLFFGARFAV